MAAFDPHTSTVSEWKFWQGREDVTLRVLAPIGAYTDHAMTATGGAAKRRAITWKEQAASAGAYTAQNLVWLLPDANLPAGTLPKAGDLVRDSDTIDHTILEAVRGKFGNTWRCTTIALAVVNALGQTGTLTRPDNTQDAALRMALTGYSTIGTSLCRVQPTDNQATDVFDRRTMPSTATAYLATPLSAQARDVFTVGSQAYTVKAVRNPERLDQLQALDLEMIL